MEPARPQPPGCLSREAGGPGQSGEGGALFLRVLVALQEIETWTCLPRDSRGPTSPDPEQCSGEITQ